MDEKMTLEMVRDWLLARTRDGQMQRSVFTSDYQLRQMADAVTAHLAQPAQSVDVEAIRKVIASIDLRAEMYLDPQCKGWADKLTAAINYCPKLGHISDTNVEK